MQYDNPGGGEPAAPGGGEVMKITINGWPSMGEWVAAGYPGARSFPPERLPDPRRGLCVEDGCALLDKDGWGGRCLHHAIARKRSRDESG